MLMQNSRHTGLATNTSISTANVSQLGLKYMANTGNWVYSSPVVATVPALGKQLVFVGGKAKFIFAFDTANGDLVWRANIQNNSSSTGAYYNGVLYIGSSDYNMYAFNAATGQQICKFNTGGVVQSSPTVVNPDGSGLRVYFGDAGLGGAPDGGHVWSMHGVDPTDAFADCSLDWSYDHFGDPPDSHGEAGSWSDASFGQLTDGTKVVVIGASSTDNAAYAFNALTGARIWRFPTPAPYPDADVGAGTTLSPPGALFPDGAAYIAGKNHHVYGINLRTGAQLWDFNMEANSPPGSNQGGRSTPALVDNTIYVGWGAGVFAINATTGAMLWRYDSPNNIDVVASPAVSGPPGSRVVFAADMAGRMFALNAQNGAELWHYQAGGLIFASTAIANGNVYFGSQDGFVYDFAIGASTGTRPHATIDSPTDKATLPPGGNVTITGTASDDLGVTKVLVSVRQDSGALWWDAGASKWQKYFVANPATMTSPGAKLTDWTFSVPVSNNGGNYTINADAQDATGQHVAPVIASSFQVGNGTGAPDTVITAPTQKQVFNLPNPPASIPLTITGSATDTTGTHPGVASVKVVVENLEHIEYWCGAPACGNPAEPSANQWTTVFTGVTVPITNPGSQSVTFSVTVPSYDHEHTYRVSAWAIDNDGNPDPFKATVNKICVRMAGDTTCN